MSMKRALSHLRHVFVLAGGGAGDRATCHARFHYGSLSGWLCLLIIHNWYRKQAHFDWQKHVEEEMNSRWAMAPNGWTDSKIG